MKFKKSKTADVGGTSLKLTIPLKFKDVEKILGKPFYSDGYKVSGEWVLVSEDGDVVTLYDWKETSLYDDDLPSVEEFRKSSEPIEFHVGAHDKEVAEKFKTWLMNQKNSLHKIK